MTYVDKYEARTPTQSGFGWTLEKLNNPGECHKMFKMNASLFQQPRCKNFASHNAGDASASEYNDHNMVKFADDLAWAIYCSRSS